jgi:hypothetical protein
MRPEPLAELTASSSIGDLLRAMRSAVMHTFTEDAGARYAETIALRIFLAEADLHRASRL